MTSLEERWRGVLDNMAEAERKAGREAGSVRLVAVSKFHPASDIEELFRLGQRDFGENYIQEARAKQEALTDPAIRWHAIGPVQTNKAKEVAGRFSLLHTLDRADLARALLRRLPEGQTQPVLIQVNIGEEEQKSGVRPGDLAALCEELLKGGLVSDKGPGLALRGFMCLPPVCGEGEAVRPYFDFILLDTAAGMGAPFTAAATVADRALLVLTPDPVALRDGKIVADRLLAGGRPQSAVRLVMNRVTRDSFGKRASVEDLDECIDTVGAQLIAVIPESVALQQAGAAGTVPPAHDAAVVAGQALAKRLCGQRVPLTF